MIKIKVINKESTHTYEFPGEFEFGDRFSVEQEGLMFTSSPLITKLSLDPIVEAVREDLLQRSQTGIKKYNTTLDRKDLELKDWLQHAYEECLDQANYLKRAIVELENKEIVVQKKFTDVEWQEYITMLEFKSNPNRNN